MKRLYDLIADHNDWLLRRVLYYAEKYNYVKYIPNLEETLQVSITGLSESLLTALQTNSQPPELRPDDNYIQDPITSFGILEAQKHRKRGINLGIFLGLLKYYRQSYIDLIHQSGFEQDYITYCHLFVERFFDRIEIGICMEWAEATKSENEEFYRAVLNSLLGHIAVLDKDGNIITVNETWERLARENNGAFPFPTGIGTNYLEVCRRALNKFAGKAQEVLAGIQAVLNGSQEQFILEYPWYSPAAKHWFLLRATPLGKLGGVVLSYVNIAERKQAEELFKKLFNSSPVGIYIVQDGKFQFVNPQFQKQTGYSEDELLGTESLLLVLPEDRSMVRENAVKMLKGERSSPYEYRVVIKSRETRWIMEKVASIQYLGRRATLGYYMDITERKRTEEELCREKKRLTVTLSSIGDAVIVVDTEGRITLINPMAESLIGWSRAEVIGRPLNEVFKIINEYTRQPVENPAKKVLTEGKIVGLANHTVLIARDGTERSISNSAAPIQDATGEVFGVILVFRDITDERRREEALRASEARFRLLAENASDIIYRILLFPEQRYEYISPAATYITGYTPEEYYADPHLGYKLIHPNDRHIFSSIVSGKFDFTKPVTLRLLHKDGQIIWTEHRNVPIYDDNGNLVAIEGVARDITERKQMEEQLKYLSLHDPLTGLYNRAHFEQEMHRLEEEQCAPVGIIVCDIDGLKLVNDTLGHDTGDALLLAAANVIKKIFREGDIVARVGGDEFAVLLPNTEWAAVESACNRIREAVAKYNTANPELPLSMSVGFAASSKAPASMGDLFKEADNNMYREKLHRSRSARSAIVKALMKALEARDFITEGHATRLQKLVTAMGRAIGLSERNIAELRLLAQFHDIGKVGIPDRILFKPGPLTPEEFNEMQRHCEIGFRIAQSSYDLAPIAEWILKHHEWWNGKGYPLGLKGEEIPLECRILAIADAYDAMTSDRPYRKAMSHEEAVAELKRSAGTQFDPQLVEKFVQVLEDQKWLK